MPKHVSLFSPAVIEYIWENVPAGSAVMIVGSYLVFPKVGSTRLH